MSGHTVADYEFADIAVLKIGNLFVPIVGAQALEIGPGHQCRIGMQGEFCLKCVCFVTPLIGRRRALVDQEYGDRTDAGWDQSEAGLSETLSGGYGAHRDHQFQSAAFWNREALRLNREVHRLLELRALPDCGGTVEIPQVKYW